MFCLLNPLIDGLKGAAFRNCSVLHYTYYESFVDFAIEIWDSFGD